MEFMHKILKEKDHPGIQFFKYACSGGIAFAVDFATFFLVAWLLFPALTEDDVMVELFKLTIEPVTEHQRTVNFVIGSILAFITSNSAAYILNILFVFKAGKHSRAKELGLFFLVSAISVGVGILAGVILIGFGLSTTFSYIAKAVSTTLINYAARKFLIFHG